MSVSSMYLYARICNEHVTYAFAVYISSNEIWNDELSRFRGTDSWMERNGSVARGR